MRDEEKLIMLALVLLLGVAAMVYLAMSDSPLQVPLEDTAVPVVTETEGSKLS